MRLSNAVFLIRQHWRFHWSSWAIVAVLVTVSAFALTMIAATTHAISRALERWTEDIFPPTTLTVRVPTPELSGVAFFLAAAMPSLDHPALTDEQIEALRALDDVTRVYPVATPGFPSHAQVTFMGEGFGTDAAIAGIDLELIQSDLSDPALFRPVDWRAGDPIPVIISVYFLDLFNLLYAPTMDLPPLSEKTVIGFDFELIIGNSVLGGSLSQRRTRRAQCVVVGLTHNPQLMGITMPVQTIEELALALQPDEPMRHSYAFVEVREAALIPAVTEAVDDMGLMVETLPEMARIATLDRLLTLASGALQMLILGLTVFAGICLITLQMEHRRPSMLFLHVSGVPGPTLCKLMMGEAGGIALASSVLGAGMAALLVHAALGRLSEMLPTSLPDPELSLFGAVLIALLCAVIISAAISVAALGVISTHQRSIEHRPMG